MAKTTESMTIIVIDDEPHNILWLIDFLESKKFKVELASNVVDSLTSVEREIFRALIIDLNIPVSDPYKKAISDRGGVYAKYPGLFVAEKARNRGYMDRQVVIYSVHKDPAVADEARKLGCTYILKGRPKEIKEEIGDIISYDPTQ